MLENTRRRPALVPAPCPYPPCISRHRPAPVRVIMRRPRGEQPLEGGKGCPPPGHRPRPARASETSRSSPPFAPRPWALGQTGKRIRDAGVATCNTAIICTAAHVCLCHTVVHSRCVLPAAPLQALLVVLHKRCVGLCVCVWCVCVCIDIYIYIYICYMYICMYIYIYIYIYSVILYIYIFSLSFSCSHSFSLSTHAHTCTHTHTHTHAPGCSTAHRPPGAHLPQP